MIKSKLMGVVFLALVCGCVVHNAIAPPGKDAVLSPPTKPLFLVRSHDGTLKCLDYGTPPTSPVAVGRTLKSAAISVQPPKSDGRLVFLNDCTAAHPIEVKEINGQHDVMLQAGSLVIGIHNPEVLSTGRTAAPPTQYSVELQPALNRFEVSYANQVFALDGDSIMLASNRNLVVQVDHARGKNGTALILSQRNLADSEFWDFSAVDGSAAYPTSGFVLVSNREEFCSALWRLAYLTMTDPSDIASLTPDFAPNAAWGSVVVVAPGAVINPGPDCYGASWARLRYGLPIFPMKANATGVPNGVTIRGDRRGTSLGPQIVQPNELDHVRIFELGDSGEAYASYGNHVRITGLRIAGPRRTRDPDELYADGISVRDDRVAIIDHNDISDWPNATVEVWGPSESAMCNDPSAPLPNPSTNIRIVRNFMHHNEAWGGGYGSVMSQGANATIVGNTFLMHRHSIADDGAALSGYNAWSNLVLSAVPTYETLHLLNELHTIYGPQQDFDMHGHGDGSHHVGGVAGNSVNIGWNTFLGGNRENLSLRGTPCGTDFFHDNVTADDSGKAINTNGQQVNVVHASQPTMPGDLLEFANQYSVYSSPGDPSDHFGVGDFDGDGTQDLFMATGTAWYFAPAGKAEWRFLSQKPETTDSLLFGDFDGDGRTDVVTKRGSTLMVSWGGVSEWEVLNPHPLSAAIGDLAVGDFVDDFPGDRRNDIFWSDGSTWRVASGGAGPFNQTQTSSFRVKDVRFGDFNSDGKTDVFGIVGGKWQVSYSASSSWTALPVSLTNSMNGLVVADFDGDGRADIAINSGNDWMISYAGAAHWTRYQINDTSRCLSPQPSLNIVPAIGNFDSDKGADVLLWDGGNELCIASGGAAEHPLEAWSRQDMR